MRVVHGFNTVVTLIYMHAPVLTVCHTEEQRGALLECETSRAADLSLTNDGNCREKGL